MSFGSEMRTISISGIVLVEYSSEKLIDITRYKKSLANSVV